MKKFFDTLIFLVDLLICIGYGLFIGVIIAVICQHWTCPDNIKEYKWVFTSACILVGQQFYIKTYKWLLNKK
jgi:hypothetical protein